VCVGVLFLGWYFRKSTPPGKFFSQRQPLPLKGFLLLSCIFMGAQLIYSLFGNSLELLLRLFGYTAMGQLDAASAQSTTLPCSCTPPFLRRSARNSSAVDW
ncbi:MAG: hypothetical protein ACLUOF_09360, partial [Ruminococcus sp.]